MLVEAQTAVRGWGAIARFDRGGFYEPPKCSIDGADTLYGGSGVDIFRASPDDIVFRD